MEGIAQNIDLLNHIVGALAVAVVLNIAALIWLLATLVSDIKWMKGKLSSICGQNLDSRLSTMEKLCDARHGATVPRETGG